MIVEANSFEVNVVENNGLIYLQSLPLRVYLFRHPFEALPPTMSFFSVYQTSLNVINKGYFSFETIYRLYF